MVAQWFLYQWQRKCLALMVAMVLWLFINQSITESQTIPNVPIRIVNLPFDKTVEGLLPNGILKQRVTLTLIGSRDVVKALEPGDIEVLVDGSMIDREDWILHINKNNLVSLNPSIDLSHYITSISHTELVIKLTPIAEVQVPVQVTPPIGEVPEGYIFLDMWPTTFMQTVRGPVQELNALKAKGLEVTFDFSKISAEELDALRKEEDSLNNEVSFPVPNAWKYVRLPFANNAKEIFNDPEAETIVLNFLHRDFLPIEHPVPIRAYYPVEHIGTINPLTYALTTSSKVELKNGVFLFTFPLYVKGVSRIFLDVIRDNLEITLVAVPPSERDVLDWSVDIVDPRELEDTYIAYMIANEPNREWGPNFLKQRSEALRKRFSRYKQQVMLWVTLNQQLSIATVLENHEIKVK